MKVTVGVSGGIAAYKAATVVRQIESHVARGRDMSASADPEPRGEGT